MMGANKKSFMDLYGGKIIGGLIALLQVIILGTFVMLYGKVEAIESKDAERHTEVIGLINDLNGKVDISVNDDTHHLRDFNALKIKVERHHP